MTCTLVVKNIPNSYATGMVVAAFKGDYHLSSLVSKKVWIDEGKDPNKYNRDFIKIVITDVDVSDALVESLLEAGTIYRRKLRLKPQGKQSPYYDQLNDIGEIYTNKATIQAITEVYSDGN